jgi:hypothetical protein
MTLFWGYTTLFHAFPTQSNDSLSLFCAFTNQFDASGNQVDAFINQVQASVNQFMLAESYSLVSATYL